MKQLLLAVLFTALTLSLTAETVNVGGVMYKLGTDGTAEITSKTPTYSGDIFVPDSFQYSDQWYKVYKVGRNSFSGSSVTSLRFPNSLKIIDSWAFANCTSLLTIDFGTGLTTINDFALQGCSSLRKLVFPDSLRTVGTGVFKLCSSLDSVIFGAGLRTIGDYSFHDCKKLVYAQLPDSLESMGVQLFLNCDTLLNINIPDRVQTIGKQTFDGCKNLRTITFGTGLKKICFEAFRDCKNLYSVILQDSVTDIEYDAFNGCTGLRKLRLGNSMRRIGDRAFQFCQSIDTAITFPATMKSIGRHCFRKCFLLPQIVFDEGIDSIHNNAFDSCFAIGDVILPNSLTYLGDESFRRCESMQYLEIGNGITDILKNTFRGCIVLDSMTLGDSLKTVGENAFAEDTSLTRIRCLSVMPPKCYNINVFDYTLYFSTYLYVHGQSVESYRTDEVWGRFIPHILPLDRVAVENVEETRGYYVENGFVRNSDNDLIKIYDIRGTFVGETDADFDLNTLPKGVYILRGKFTTKVVN